MANKVTINFSACLPVPAGGYKVTYKPQGSTGSFREYPDIFMQSPAVLIIEDDPDGTEYYGYLTSLCETSWGSSVPWGEDVPPAPVISWQGSNSYCETQANCPAGYMLSVDGQTCTKVESQAPVTSETPVHAAGSTNGAYSDYGMRIFDLGFSQNGNGTSSYNSSNEYWSNQLTNLIDGPMNRNGIWVDNNNDGIVDPLQAGKQLSVSFGLTVLASKIYYIGLGGDNQVKLLINNILIVDRNDASESENFKWWNVYPVALNAGYNLITVTGTGDGSYQDCLAMEIYDNEPGQLINASSDDDITVLFRTRDLRGGVLQIVTCNAGYSPIDNGDGTFVCQRVLQQASAQQNTGTLIYAKRVRLSDGVADGYIEDNTQTGGLGPYIPKVLNSPTCS